MRNSKRNGPEDAIKTPVVTSKPMNQRRVKGPVVAPMATTIDEVPSQLTTMKHAKMHKKRTEKQRRKVKAIAIPPSQATLTKMREAKQKESEIAEADGEAEQSENDFENKAPAEKPVSSSQEEVKTKRNRVVQPNDFPRLESRDKLSMKRE